MQYFIDLLQGIIKAQLMPMFLCYAMVRFGCQCERDSAYYVIVQIYPIASSCDLSCKLNISTQLCHSGHVSLTSIVQNEGKLCRY